MAGILHEFVQNTKILASQVNENFDVVQGDIEELGNGLNTKFSSEITKAKEELIEDINTKAATKADKDLGNVSESGINKVMQTFAPNYTAGYSISSGWIAPENGWIKHRIYSSASGGTSVLINDIVVAENWQGKGDGRAGGFYITGMTYILKGQNVKLGGDQANDSNNRDALYFYPCNKS